MAKVVVLSQQGIEPAVGRYDYLIQGDPSVLGLTAAVNSLAIQVDSATPFAQWQKTTTGDFGWALVPTSAGAGASSATGSWRASAFSVAVDGTTDATSALNTLTGTTMPQAGGPYALIVGPGETIKTSSDVTIPATVQIQSTGGTFKPASGKKVTIAAQPTGAGKMFDQSAGGVVLSSAPMVSNPAWWGADKTGVSGSSTAFDAALGFLAADTAPGGGAPTGTWGGRVHIPAGTYLLDSYGQQFGDAYGNLILEGDGPSTVLTSPAGRVVGVALEWKGMFSFYGASQYSLQKLMIRDMRFKGNSTSDATTFLIIDSASDVTLENLYFETNGMESVRSLSGTGVKKMVVHNCHAVSVGGARNAGWMNVGAQQFTMTDCTVTNSSTGLETANSYTTVSNCRFQDMNNWGTMIFSTWSGWLDPNNSFAQYNAYGATINGNQYINIADRALLFPDYTGHTNPDGAHPTPAHLDGNKGQITIANNLFDRTGICIWGGADLLGTVDCHGNQFMGQRDAGSGPQNTAVCPQGGTWNIHDNTFALGTGIQWVNLIGAAFATPKTDRMSIVDNIVINKCWGSGTAMAVKQDTTIRGTRFLDLDGTIAAAPTATMYKITDPADASRYICELKTSEWAWQDPNHQICMGSEPTILPVNGNTLPATISFKPGDVLVNRGGSASVGWFNKKCVTGGTINPVALSTTTATGTSGVAAITLANQDAVLMTYGWIYFPAIPAIAPKRMMISPATNNTVTLNAPLEATVTAGTAVAWASPTWITDRDAQSLTIASQAAGDLLYASSSTAFTRLAAGAVGTYLQGGPTPAWTDSIARFDAGNSGSAKTITRTAARQEQKCTLSAATPAITIDDTAIPSGGYLIVDFFQDATGSRVPTWALTSAGTINWVGGVAPVLTTTATKADRTVWHNEGTRITAWCALANF